MQSILLIDLLYLFYFQLDVFLDTVSYIVIHFFVFRFHYFDISAINLQYFFASHTYDFISIQSYIKINFFLINNFFVDNVTNIIYRITVSVIRQQLSKLILLQKVEIKPSNSTVFIHYQSHKMAKFHFVFTYYFVENTIGYVKCINKRICYGNDFRCNGIILMDSILTRDQIYF